MDIIDLIIDGKIRKAKKRIRVAVVFREVLLAVMAFLLICSYIRGTSDIGSFIGIGVFFLCDMLMTVLWFIWRKIFVGHFLTFIFLGFLFYLGWFIELDPNASIWRVVMALYMALVMWLINLIPFLVFRAETKVLLIAEREKMHLLEEIQNCVPER